MNYKLNICPNCNDRRSYSEKFFICFLDQLCELYDHNICFDWSDNKEYDFWLVEHNMIIEANGKQHYQKSFGYSSSRNLIEEQMNDEYKKELALNNGIKDYIEIDCRKSDKEYIKHSILNSLLPTLLLFDKDDIDWDECHRFALKNIIYNVCIDYKNGFNYNQLIEKYDKCKNTITDYLKKGSILGWCDYDTDEIRRITNINNGKRIVETMSKKVCQIDNNNNIIKIYDSLQEAQRLNNIHHIWDVITGKRKTSGGYKWRYYDE